MSWFPGTPPTHREPGGAGPPRPQPAQVSQPAAVASEGQRPSLPGCRYLRPANLQSTCLVVWAEGRGPMRGFLGITLNSGASTAMEVLQRLFNSGLVPLGSCLGAPAPLSQSDPQSCWGEKSESEKLVSSCLPLPEATHVSH